MARNKVEDLKNSGLVLEQWIFLLISREEHGLCTTEENIQAFVFDHDPSVAFYRFVFPVFSESNVLERLKKKKDFQLEKIAFYNLLHAQCKMFNSI